MKHTLHDWAIELDNLAQKHDEAEHTPILSERMRDYIEIVNSIVEDARLGYVEGK